MTLTQSQAQFRSTLIVPQSISYNLHLSLYPKFYRSLSQCKFTLHQKNQQQLFIDCSSKKIINFAINGKKVQNIKQVQSLLYFPIDKLNIGENTLLVLCQNQYNTDQRGLMSFVDVDQKQYLYTTLQAYFAHRVFAVFDQPDLKAVMTLSVICPHSWTKVLSNMHPTFNLELNQQKYISEVPSFYKNQLQTFVKSSCEQYKQQQIKQLRMALFPKTELMPTYLFCVMAGPFEQIPLPKQQQYNKIPMSIYCSAQQLPHVKKMSQFLFQTTLQCMKFYQQFFRVPYCFTKYDQIFVHQMQSCAMQNTGMVTYHDAEYIWREQFTQEMALDLADTMAHQLAHHWFGNLTTMKWWDDLWLNQSFAQFVGYYCMEVIQKRLKIVKYQSSMAQFLNKKFQRGYRDDQSVTTHPIRGTVANTAVAQSIFDGITYVKGASTLKQLLFLMGEQNFSSALQKYFTKFAFKNTTLDDFINCLQEKFDNEYGLDLQEWKRVWLQSCSLNELQTTWWRMNPTSPQTQKILTVLQRPYTQKYPTLRPHKIKIALFKPDCTFDVISTFIPASAQIDIPIDPVHAQNYHAILLNYKDHTFAKVVLDSISRQFFMKNILKIKDTLTRTYIWRIFYDMVKDAVIPSTQYIQFFIKNIRDQVSDVIVQRNYQSAYDCVQYYTPQKYRLQLFNKLFYFTLQTLKLTPPDHKNRLISLRDGLCQFANCEQTVKILYKWYEGKQQNLVQHKTSKTNQWQIVTKVLQHLKWTNQQKQALLNKQAQIDQSDEGKLQVIKNTAILASPQQFQSYYLSLLDPSSTLTVNTKKYLIQGLTTIPHIQKLLKIKPKYFCDLQVCTKTLQSQHVRLLIINMQPTDDNLQETISYLRNIKIEEEKLDKARYKLQQLVDLLQKRIKGYQRFVKEIDTQK